MKELGFRYKFFSRVEILTTGKYKYTMPCACRARELEGALAARPAEPHCPPLQDSYLLDYFFSLNRYFEVGAPVYFVTTGGFNFSSAEGMNSICSSAGCDSSSLSQKIQYATEFPEQ